MKSYIQSGVLLLAGMLGAAAATATADSNPTRVSQKFSCREAALQRFLVVNHSPLASYAADFVAEAGEHHLDWRLLPAIAFVESGAGIHGKKNNAFGWDNGEAEFQNNAEAIHHVAQVLDRSRGYRGRSVAGKLLTYNQDSDYGPLVVRVMRRIAPDSQGGL